MSTCLSRKLFWVAIIVVSLVATLPVAPARANITITPDDIPLFGPWSHFAADICPSPDPACGACYCFTRTSYYGRIDSPAAGSAFDRDMQRDYAAWTWNSPLNPPVPPPVPPLQNRSGTLTVRNWQPIVCEWLRADPNPNPGSLHCWHGAQLIAEYTPDVANGENAVYRFVQHMDHWQGLGGLNWGPQCNWGIAANGGAHPTTHIDPLAGGPFYTARWGDNVFRDTPERGCRATDGPCLTSPICPAPCRWGATFQTYVAEETGPTSMIVYDGIEWGFTAYCVPGPNVREGAPAGGANPGAALHFDPVSRTLAFADSTLDVLNLDGSGTMDPAFAGDPILGATISIDDFQFVGGDAGVYVLEGGEMRIEKDGVVYVRAAIPLLLVDDQARGEFTDNMFGDFIDMQFDLGHGSAWLEAYQQSAGISDQRQEFRANSLTDLEPALESLTAYDGTAYAWAAHCVVPEPAMLGLLALGALAILRRRRR